MKTLHISSLLYAEAASMLYNYSQARQPDSEIAAITLLSIYDPVYYRIELDAINKIANEQLKQACHRVILGYLTLNEPPEKYLTNGAILFADLWASYIDTQKKHNELFSSEFKNLFADATRYRKLRHPNLRSPDMGGFFVVQVPDKAVLIEARLDSALDRAAIVNNV